jgi:ATP-binding cassette subfamily B (MDR/TAP) protein 6
VKYFSNEELERRNFEKAIRDYQKVEYTLIASLNGLNVLQSVIIWSGMIGGLIVCTQVITHLLQPVQAALSLPAWCCSGSNVPSASHL